MALRRSIGELAATLLSLVRTRLELLSIVAAGQKSHLIRLAALAFGALLFLTLALLVFSIAVALYFWPSDHRYTALFVLALVYAVLGVLLFFWVRRTLVREPMPFSATLEELQRDIELVEGLVHSDERGSRHSNEDRP